MTKEIELKTGDGIETGRAFTVEAPQEYWGGECQENPLGRYEEQCVSYVL